MIGLLTANLPAIVGGIAGLLGLVAVYFGIKNSGRRDQQAADMEKTLEGVSARQRIDAEVAGESDAAVAADLRSQRGKG